MVTIKEQILECKTTQEFAKWVATFMHSGKLNPDIDYENANNIVKIMRWLESDADE